MSAINLFPGDRVKWRKVYLVVQSTYQDNTVDLLEPKHRLLIQDVDAMELIK